ncbi:hypothetical protein LIER_29805 [Lithospermum erythrorhizon]|uniref:Uncharacterized protein n=1 Tax=Lithospermum erythrorhizon TaxID=34254 RepID=A0AAV3RRB6_LITER
MLRKWHEVDGQFPRPMFASWPMYSPGTVPVFPNIGKDSYIGLSGILEKKRTGGPMKKEKPSRINLLEDA